MSRSAGPEVGFRLVPEAFDGVPAERIRQGLGHGGVAAELSGVGQQGVGAVEEPEFAVLVGLDVRDEHGAGVFPARPPGGEVAAEDPVVERFGHHRGVVAVAAGRLDGLNVRAGGARGDAVHGGADEAGVRLDPGRQPGIPGPGHAHDGVVGHGAVVGRGCRSRRRRAVPAPAARRAARASTSRPSGVVGLSAAGRQQRKVGGDVGRGPVQAAVGAEAVGGLGDGQGDHGGGGGGDQRGEPPTSAPSTASTMLLTVAKESPPSARSTTV